jgi:ankyrin repeat protein
MQETISKDPLIIAITSRDEIDVQMILDELGPAAAGSISSRDQYGRTALHMAALSKSPKIVSMLLGCYRIYEGRQLAVDLQKLEEEYHRTIAEIMKKISNTENKNDRNEGESKESRRSRTSQVSSVKEWFDLEKARKMRQFEFRAEVSQAFQPDHSAFRS